MLELVLMFGFYVLGSAQNFETGDNSTVTGCSIDPLIEKSKCASTGRDKSATTKSDIDQLANFSYPPSHCSMNDGDLTCWNRTLHFYEKILLAQLRHYVAVQVNIDQWHKHHDEHYTANFTALKDEAIRTFDSALSEDDIINSTTISAIVSALIDRVQAKSDSPLRRTPHFSCPLPCEYRFNLWRNLFIASCVLIAGLLVAVIPFIRSMIVSDSRDPLIK